MASHCIFCCDPVQVDDPPLLTVVEVTNPKDLAAYCIVEHLKKHDTGRMRLTDIGVLLTNLFRRAPQLDYGKVKALVRAYPDKLCFSTTADAVTLRISPHAYLPVSDDEVHYDDQLQSNAPEIDSEDAFVSESLEHSPVTLLRDAVSRYLKRSLELKGCNGGLGKEPQESDATILAQRFSQCVRDHGILRLEVILAEVDQTCSVRNISEDAWYCENLFFLSSLISVCLINTSNKPTWSLKLCLNLAWSAVGHLGH